MRQERYITGSPGLAHWYVRGAWYEAKTDGRGVTRISIVQPGTRVHGMLNRKRARLIELRHKDKRK